MSGSGVFVQRNYGRKDPSMRLEWILIFNLSSQCSVVSKLSRYFKLSEIC